MAFGALVRVVGGVRVRVMKVRVRVMKVRVMQARARVMKARVRVQNEPQDPQTTISCSIPLPLR